LGSEHPFFLLLRSRRAWYRRQSFALYLRYAHVLAVLLALTGSALAERPEMLAAPILHFWRSPDDPLANAGWAFAWLACVFVWVRVHRPFVAGGALAAFARSLPGAVRAGPFVDAVMLFVSLQVFLVPIGLAAWTVARGGGSDVLFAAQALLLAVLTLGVARLAMGGAGRLAWVLHVAGFVALCGGPGALGISIAAVVTGAAVTRMLASAHTVLRLGRVQAAGRSPSGTSALFLLRLQCIVLARRHLHATVPRLALAVGIMTASLWMVFGVGKLAESSAFVKVGCWLAVSVMSGFYYLFWTTRQPLQPFLASLPCGAMRMALSEHLLVLGASGLLFAGAWAACLMQPAHGDLVAAQLLRHGAAALAVLPLLGLPILQRHQDGVLIKVAILVASFLLL
jgi:hypothetical protein